MKRREFLKLLALSAPALYLSHLPFASATTTITNIQSLRINLGSAGRIGFYIDYSELSAPGTHTFYVFRTHGTQGQVSVDFTTLGDAHTIASGTLTWGNGEADVKSFTVTVAAKTPGDHRIVAQLSNPTGGAVLHNENKTKAYGVIDDGSIAPDSEAVFADFDAGVNGNGTQANPYNNPYDAIANVGNKRYIYLKGTHVPDGTNVNNIGGTFRCIAPPATRTSETARVYIRNWPGATCTIDGSGRNDCLGFYTRGSESYHTYRGIRFTNLDVTGVSGFNNGAGIFYHYGTTGSSDINVELCEFRDITGTTNNGGYLPWGVNGSKMWRCHVDLSVINASGPVQKTHGMIYYQASNISVQRCYFNGCNYAIYPKGMSKNTVRVKSGFNIIENCTMGFEFGFNSSGGYADYILIHNNLLRKCKTYYGIFVQGAAADQNGKVAIFNNVFDDCGASGNGAIYSRDSYDLQMFNNIYFNCAVTWDTFENVAAQSNPARNQVEYADYEHRFGTGTRYRHLSVSYADSTAMNTAFSTFAGNDSSGDPLFTNPNPAVNDYTLRAGSPCTGNGVSGVNQGIYLTGIEKLGPLTQTVSPVLTPSPPTQFRVS